MIHTVKDFGIVSEAEVDFFSGIPFLFLWSSDAWNLISSFSAFSKSSLIIWKFLVHVLLKPNLENFEHYFASMWDECNCVVVWTFFGIAFLWDWNADLFQSCGHCWVFQICWYIECSTLIASSFRIWNSSAEIPSLPLALFVVMLPKAHLTLHYTMSGSSWVTKPSWLTGSLRPFLYSSSVYSCHFFLSSSVSVSPCCFCPLLCPSFHEMFHWYLKFSWRDI